MLHTWRFAPWLEKWAWDYRKFVWLFILAFYLMSFNGLWRPTPDSALYLSIARSLARGEGYVYLGEAHRLAYPGLPYAISGLMQLFGEHAIAITIGIMMSMTLIALALCYRLFRMVVAPGAAVVVTLITSVNFKLYDLTFDILTDIPFLLGTMMVLLGAAWSGVAPAPRLSEEAEVPGPRQRKLGWVLLPAGLMLCAVMRPTFYLLAGCLIIAGLIQVLRVRKAVLSMAMPAVATLVLAIVLVLVTMDPRRSDNTSDLYEQAISWHLKHATSDLSIPLRNGWSIVSPELPSAFFSYSWSAALDPIVVALLLGAIGWVLWRWPLAIIWIGGTLALQLIVDPIPRYMLPIMPLLVLAWWAAAARLSSRFSFRTANFIAITAYLVLVPNLCRGVGQVWYEQYGRPFMAYYHQGRFLAVDEMAQLIRERVPEDAVVITPERSDRVFTYLADRWSIAPGQVIPQALRERPVWIVFAKDDPDWRSALLPMVTPGKKECQTNNAYRSNGPLVLRQATWKQPAQ